MHKISQGGHMANCEIFQLFDLKKQHSVNSKKPK